MTKKKAIQSIPKQSKSPSNPKTTHSSQSAPSFDELELLIKTGDSERLRQRINDTSASFDINITCSRSPNMTLLMVASELGDLESVKVLIEKHANINKSNNENKTALHYACISDNNELIEYLIDQSITINDQVLMDCFIVYILRHIHIDPYPTVLLTLIDHVKDINCIITNQFQTFIQAACYFGHNDVVSAVLSMGADPRLPHNECPLSVAARQGHIEIVKLLLQFTEKSPLPRDQIKEALISASAAGNLQMVIILRDFASGVVDIDIFNSALHPTIQYNHIDILIYLLEQGANANYIDGHHGYCILKYACIYSPGDASDKGRYVQVLLDHGADGHEVDEQGDSLLLHTQNNPEAAIILINYGLDVNQHFANGTTLLLITANSIYNNDIYMLTCLLQNGADVNISHKYTKYTSIMYAIKCQCYNGVKLLLEYGADLTLPNNEGKDSIHILKHYTDKSNIDSMNISTVCYEYLKINKNINIEKAILK